jgi:glycine hydroxymethyltransferase
MQTLKKSDPEIAKLIKQEEQRQSSKLNLIPSENFYSKSVRQAIGSVLMHKYSEGNIGQRYYAGNQIIDKIESLAIARAKKLFKVPKDWEANVQAISGSNANLAVYLTVLKAGDTILSMYLPDGGHLSHGWSYGKETKKSVNQFVYEGGERKVNITSRLYDPIQYKTDPKTCRFDYDAIEKIAKKYKPKLIITGGTAYPRDIDYKRIKKIAKKVGALYLADIAHEAGLIAAGVLGSPVGIADVVTMTTHKTLRSGRGSIILAHKDLITKINKAILPGLQGGPFDNNIAGIAVGLKEARKPSFKTYAKQVLKNAKVLSNELLKYEFNIVSGGTDKHLILINLINKNILGKYTERALDHAGIVVNKNTMPQETRSPMDPSAIRLGTPFVTTQGMKEKQMKLIAKWINEVVEEAKKWENLDFAKFEAQVKKSPLIKRTAKKVKALTKQFPLEI